MNAKRVDLAVVGAGIAGLAHALAAARSGRSVVVFERADRARGASVRNFGALWPIGMARGRSLALGLRGREVWLEVAEKAGIWHDPCGSLFVTYSDEEWAVVQEFAERGPGWGFDVEAITPDAALAQCPHVNGADLRGALFSRTEVRVDARRAIPAIAAYLGEHMGVEFRFGTSVVGVDDTGVETAEGERWEADAVVVASGDDFRTLLPETFASIPGLTRCKLQMMRTVAQPGGFDLGPHVAGGLSLRHYQSFADLRATEHLRAHVASTRPDHDRFGIHVMASQTTDGEVILGDSHEYARDFTPDYSAAIESMILDEARRMFDGIDLTIADRWIGYYAKAMSPETPMVVAPSERVRAVSALSGAGMTLSFALAEETIASLGMGEHRLSAAASDSSPNAPAPTG